MLIVARGLKAYNFDCFSIGDLNSTTASVSRFSMETLMKGVGSNELFTNLCRIEATIPFPRDTHSSKKKISFNKIKYILFSK